MFVSDAIQTKRAVRKFKDTPLKPEEINAILQAGRRAQSSKNMQAWHFVAVQDRESLIKLSKMGTYAGHLAGAALGVAILTPDPAIRFSMMFDAGQAAGYMQLAAWEMGIGSCLATIYDPDAARKLLQYPDDLHINIAISFGYPENPSVLTSPPKGPGRKSWDEIMHFEKFGNSN